MVKEPPTVPAVFDEDLIRRRLARAVDSADFLDRHVAEEATDRLALAARPFGAIAVRGRRPALVAALLAERYPQARIEIIGDPALSASRPVACEVVALGPEAMNDVPAFLSRCRADLEPDGLFVAAMLAGESLRELREAWMAAEVRLHQGASPRVAPFAGVRELGGLLQRAGFAMPVVDREQLAARYGDPLAVMRELKAMGWANPLVQRSRRPVTAGLLMAAVEAYESRFADPDGRVRASFEIAWLTGWSPGPGQPVPLRPGSAKMRLADALGTVERKPG